MKIKFVLPFLVAGLSIVLLSFRSSKTQEKEITDAVNYSIDYQMVDNYITVNNQPELLQAGWVGAIYRFAKKVWQRSCKLVVYEAVSSALDWLLGSSYTTEQITELEEMYVIHKL